MPDAPVTEGLDPTYRYLPSPEKTLIKRHVPTAVMPLAGDFVVFSVDPVASVAHLDKVARQAAKKIRTHRHIGLVMAMKGLPMDDDPVNAFSFAFLRKGLPRTAPPDSFPELAIPVLPNTFHLTGCEPLRPIHPLPWSDCYISATNDLNFRTLRVKTTSRDYTPILPLEPEEVWRLSCFIDDSEFVAEEKMRRIQQGSLEAIAALPLPQSPVSAKNMPLPIPPTTTEESEKQRGGDGATLRSSASSYEEELDVVHGHTDNVSMIGSVDSDSPEGPSAGPTGDIDIGFLQQFEHFLNNAGSVDDPVVDIWYDLDMVKEVVDISLFLEELAQIRRVINDAEERLGIRAVREAAAAKEKQLRIQRLRAERSQTRKRGLLDRLSDFLQTALRTVVCQSGVHD